MEFAVQRQILSAELGRLNSIIPKNPAIPILETIKITSDGQSLKFAATDMETTILSHVTSKLLAVTAEGTMCVPAKRLNEIVKACADGPVKITSDPNDWITIIAKGSRFRIPGQAVGKFPDLPGYDGIEWTELPSKQFKTMMAGVKYAITKEESRHNMAGAKLEVEGIEGRLIATDGSRISKATIQLPSMVMNDFEVLIPVIGIEELLKITTDYTGPIGVGVDAASQLFFKAEGRVLITRLLVGKFPRYQGIFAGIGTYSHFVIFKSDELTASINRAMLSADARDNRICLTFKQGTLRIDAATAELGEANELLESNFNGPDTKIYFNGQYLVDFLEQVGTGEVKFEIKDANSQAFITAVKDEVKMSGAVMPMHPPGIT